MQKKKSSGAVRSQVKRHCNPFYKPSHQSDTGGHNSDEQATQNSQVPDKKKVRRKQAAKTTTKKHGNLANYKPPLAENWIDNE